MEHEDIFITHLRKLYRSGLISDKAFKQVYTAHEQFQIEKSQALNNRPAVHQPIENPPKSAAAVKPIKQKAPKSKAELRERNITWSLIAGVIMLLFGGLMFATNNWSSYSPIAKTLWVALICLFFYGIHLVTDKIFKITKSSFSFLVLAALFFPVIWVSAGYFHLFGTWLSIDGGGRYLFGFLSSFITTALYLYFMRRHFSLFFTSFVYAGITITVGFLVKFIIISEDLFFLCMTLINFLLLIGRERLTSWVNHTLFTNHYHLYIQANLVLVSLFTLFLFESKTINGFSILLSSVLYLLVSQYQNRKEYYYIFPILLIYGVYQTFNHLSHEAAVLLMAALGFVFTALLHFQQERSSADWSTLYRYTGTAVTFIAFSYVSLDTFFVQNGDEFVTSIAYFLMYATILALTKKIQLVPIAGFGIVYLFLGCFSLGLALSDWTHMSLTWPFLLISTLIMYGVVLFAPFSYLQKYKMVYYNAVHLIFLLLAGYAAVDSVPFGIWLVTIIQSILLYIERQSPLAKVVPFLLAVGWYSFFSEFSTVDGKWIPFYLAIILWLTALAAYRKLPKIRLMFDYLSGGLYALGILLCFVPAINEPDNLWPVFLFAFGMILFSHLAKINSVRYLWIGAGLAFLFTYFAAIRLFDTGSWASFLCLLGPVLLAAAEYYLKRRIAIFPFFLYTALISFLVACMILEITGMSADWEYILGIGLFYYAGRLVHMEWMKKLTLYLSMSFVPLMIGEWGLKMDWSLSTLALVPFISALTYFFYWLLANPATKKRLMYFIVLFMSLGLPSSFFMDEGYSIIFVLIYSGLLIFFIHQTRLFFILLWPMLTFILIWKGYVSTYLSDSMYLELAGAMTAILLFTVMGTSTFKQPFQHSGKWIKSEPILDWYLVGSFIYLVAFPVPHDAFLFLKMLPGLVAAGLFYVQIQRFENQKWRRIMMTVTIMALLQPYYVLISNIGLPSYVEMEAYLLPLIFVLLILEKKVWRYNGTLSQLHKIALVLTSALIVYDAILENSVEEAITVGSLSLAAAIYGFYGKRLLYFSTGISMILLNVFLQTRPYWGNLPWWWYLFIGGAILITVAALNEWKAKKNEQNGKKENLFQEISRRIKLYFRGWK
ncbi:hypothetical protein [Pradoshia sp.]|uniref:hypothetical protein n=1 Tax=Pradoshia sp. TaxID=2651281 RepID=UPI003F11E2BB